MNKFDSDCIITDDSKKENCILFNFPIPDDLYCRVCGILWLVSGQVPHIRKIYVNLCHLAVIDNTYYLIPDYHKSCRELFNLCPQLYV